MRGLRDGRVFNADGGAGGAGGTGNPLVDAAKGAEGGGAPGAGGAPGGAGPAAGGPPKGPEGAPPASYLPEGLPKELAGANERETLDKLWKAHSSLPKPPEKPDGYAYQVPKDLEGFIKPDTDPVLKGLREIGHKIGLTQTQFEALINETTRAEIKAGRLSKPVDIADVFAELGEGGGDRAGQIGKGQGRVRAIVDQIDGLTTREQLSKDDAKALKVALSDAPTTRAIERVLSLLPKEHGIQNGGKPGGTGQPKSYEDVARSLYPSMYPKAAGAA